MMFLEEFYLGIVYVECIQQYVFRTSSGMSFVWTQSMGFPTYLEKNDQGYPNLDLRF